MREHANRKAFGLRVGEDGGEQERGGQQRRSHSGPRCQSRARPGSRRGPGIISLMANLRGGRRVEQNSVRISQILLAVCLAASVGVRSVQ